MHLHGGRTRQRQSSSDAGDMPTPTRLREMRAVRGAVVAPRRTGSAQPTIVRGRRYRHRRRTRCDASWMQAGGRDGTSGRARSAAVAARRQRGVRGDARTHRAVERPPRTRARDSRPHEEPLTRRSASVPRPASRRQWHASNGVPRTACNVRVVRRRLRVKPRRHAPRRTRRQRQPPPRVR